MSLEIIRVFKPEIGGIEAYVDVCFNNAFIMNGFKVLKNKKGELWVADPSLSPFTRKDKKTGKETKEYPRACGMKTKTQQKNLQTDLLKAYNAYDVNEVSEEDKVKSY